MNAPRKNTELVLIAALARDRVIGKDNRLLWHLPEDMKHFKSLTQGHTVIMGRKTWESLPEKFRPLPGRQNIVISRNPDYVATGATVVTSLEEATRVGVTEGNPCGTGGTALFVIGGAEIYALALPLADRMELTEIDATYEGDAFFPAWSSAEWREEQRQTHHTGNNSTDASGGGFDYAFVSLRRIKA